MQFYTIHYISLTSCTNKCSLHELNDNPGKEDLISVFRNIALFVKLVASSALLKSELKTDANTMHKTLLSIICFFD